MAVLRRNCPHCPAEHVAFTLTWADHPPHGSAWVWNCAAICGACRKPICFEAQATNTGNHTSPMGFNGEIENLWRVTKIWPDRQPSLAPPHTPEAIKRRFLEGEDAYRRQSWNAAVAMYRSALDIATKSMEGVPRGQTFYKRLEWLHDQHMITPDIRAWADAVRVEGNDALHDPEDFTENDTKPLRLFTEMFLRYVFELPGEVRAFRGAPG
jgi:hypothetical protein